MDSPYIAFRSRNNNKTLKATSQLAYEGYIYSKRNEYIDRKGAVTKYFNCVQRCGASLICRDEVFFRRATERLVGWETLIVSTRCRQKFLGWNVEGELSFINRQFDIAAIKGQDFTFNEVKPIFDSVKEIIPGLKSARVEIQHKKDDHEVLIQFKTTREAGHPFYNWGEYKTLHFEVRLKTRRGLEERLRVWTYFKAFTIPIDSQEQPSVPEAQLLEIRESDLHLVTKLCSVDLLNDCILHDKTRVGGTTISTPFKFTIPIRITVLVSKHTIPKASRMSSTINLMKKLLSEGVRSDLLIIVDDREFPCHKSILAAQSNVFTAMFETQMEEGISQRLKIPDMSATGVEAFLKYIYYKDIEAASCNDTVALELLKAAHKYAITDMESEFKDVLLKINDEKFDSQSAFTLFEFARNVEGFQDLQKKAAAIFLKNAQKYHETGVFVNIMQTNPKVTSELVFVMTTL